MKKLLLILLYIFFPTIVFATTLNGGVSVDTVWDVNSAREELFAKMPQNINVTTYPPFDPYFGEVQKNIKNNNLVSSNSRGEISYFRDKNGNFSAYAIRYFSKPNLVIHYNINGKTEELQFDFKENNYIRKYKYAYPQSNLLSMALSVGNEDFMYYPNGNFLAHWIGSSCYNEKGQLTITREYKEF